MAKLYNPTLNPRPRVETCTGEAHSNPHIDHCWVCMPYWGNYPVCGCGHKLSVTGAGFICRACHIRYTREQIAEIGYSIRGAWAR